MTEVRTNKMAATETVCDKTINNSDACVAIITG